MNGLLNNGISIKILIIILIISFFIINNIQGQSTVIDDGFNINNKMIIDYFGVDLGTAYKDIEKIIKESELIVFSKSDKYIRIYGILSGIEKINFTDLYFTDGVVTNMAVYIDRDINYLDTIYKNLKEIIDINYKDQEKTIAEWTNGNISIELKLENPGIDYNKMICLQYYKNNYKKDIRKEIKSKSLSFSIGGGINIGQSFIIEHFLVPMFFVTDRTVPAFSAEILIPFTFTYFPTNNFGIGFSINLGLKLESYPFFNDARLFNINMINNLMISNKFGLINKFYFLLEYGADFMPRFNIIYKPVYFAGPSLFFGLELVTKKGFTFTAGNKISVTFADNPNVSGSQKWTVTNVMVDFQFMFRYQYFKYLTNK